MFLKIGELAKRAGLSVRTLHHYDSIGLLSPSARTDSAARLYGHQDLIRLHRIQALKGLGYSLPDIQQNLDDSHIKPLEIIERQIAILDQQERHARELRQRLEYLATHLQAGDETNAADWLNLLEMMTMYQRHLTLEEMVALRSPKGSTAGTIAKQWAMIVEEVDQAMRNGIARDSAQAHALAWRWMRLVSDMTDNNAALANKLKGMQLSEPRMQEILGVDAVKFVWIGEAFVHARTALFAKYLTPIETEELRQRQLSASTHMENWPKLVALVREQMQANTQVESESVQALAQRWRQLFRDSYCGDNAALESKVRTAFMHEPDLMLGAGIDEALMVYIQKAMMYLHQSQMQPVSGGPKPSAKMVAIQRAVHSLLDSPLVLDDPLALRILGAADAAVVQADLSNYQDPLSKGLRTSLVVRSRLAEDEWASAFARGIRQCVVLGAGLDTFAYRCQHTEGRFYEVDLPSTQMWKQQCLHEAGIAVPDSLTYVPIDFESSTLSQGLEKAGFDVGQPAFFIWLGVTMYLQEQAVLDTLRFIASCAKGSGVVFDYVVPASSLPLMLRSSIEMMAKYLADRGEPWKCYFEPAELEAKLSALGFGLIHNFTPAELNQRYLTDRQDGLQLGGLTRLMHAQV
jgi:methyltransferase (TIGR00027 family)